MFVPCCIRLKLWRFVIAQSVELRNVHHPRYLDRHHRVVHFVWEHQDINGGNSRTLHCESGRWWSAGERRPLTEGGGHDFSLLPRRLHRPPHPEQLSDLQAAAAPLGLSQLL